MRLDKVQQILIHLIDINIVNRMRSPRVHLELAMAQQLDRLQPSRLNRNNLVVIAVKHQDRNINLLQVLGKIRLGKILDAVVGGFEARIHSLLPPAPDLALALVGVGPVESEKGAGGHIQEELAAVLVHGLPERVEDGLVRALRVGLGLEHKRRHGSDEDGLVDAAGAVLSEVMRHFAAAVGVPDHDGIFDAEVFEELLEIVDKGVHVVSVPCLRGATVAAAVVSDDAEPVVGQEDHLVLPVVAAQWPAVRKGDDGALGVAPVLVEELGSVSQLEMRHDGVDIGRKVAE